MNTNNSLAKLNEQQLDQLYAWLQDETAAKVRSRIAAPPPEGFGLEVSVDVLGRFYRKRRAIARAADALILLEPKSPTSLERFHLASLESFAHLTYEMANSPGNARAFTQLSNWFAKREYNEIQRQYLDVAKAQLELTRQRLELETFKSQFNFARLTGDHVNEIQNILADPTIDDQEKINRTRPILWGHNAIPTPPYPPLAPTHKNPDVTIQTQPCPTDHAHKA